MEKDSLLSHINSNHKSNKKKSGKHGGEVVRVIKCKTDEAKVGDDISSSETCRISSTSKSYVRHYCGYCSFKSLNRNHLKDHIKSEHLRDSEPSKPLSDHQASSSAKKRQV